MASRVKLSNRFQIVVPAEVRKKLGIDRGDHLLVDVRGNSILLLPEPRDYGLYLRGLHSDVWEGQDPQKYVEHEREVRQG